MIAGWERRDAERAIGHMLVEANLLDLASLPAFLLRQVLNPAGVYHGARLIVIDSVQGHGLPAAKTTTYDKIIEFARLAEQNGITTILLSRVTKRGDIAGPRALEHGVDAALHLRRAMQFALLSVRKNRYGPPLLRPLPLQPDPLTYTGATTSL
jgi:predicted ATP-dependent serine protease